jgi:hypothetical protein
MRATIAVTAIMLATTAPALASRTQATGPTPIDVAASPAYAPDIAPVGRHFYRRHHHVARREKHRAEHHAERHHAGHKQPVERLSMIGVQKPPVPAPASASQLRALALGAILGIPEGWEDGIATAAASLVNDLSYLIGRASDSPTIERQGAALAVGRLHPVFRARLAAAFREADASGIHACIQSAYRPPGFGIGGFRDKFRSAHSYGLAVDVCGLGGPGTSAAIEFRRIAARHGIYSPYSVFSRAEFNHFQPTLMRLVADEAPLRGTITVDGPKDLERMWKIASVILAPEGARAFIGEEHVARRHRHERIHYAHHHRLHYAAR